MKLSLKKKSPGFWFFSLFLLLALIFSVFRYQIGSYAAWFLAMTREIKITEKQDKPGSGSGTIKIITGVKVMPTKKGVQKKKAKPVAKKSSYFKKPVTAKLPKTKLPQIVWSTDYPVWKKNDPAIFESLRKYDGTVWTKERTRIRISTDGSRLFFLCRFYDKHPDQAITRNNATNAYRDDSIEIFLMKNRKSKHYCQYIISVDSQGRASYITTTDIPNRGSKVNAPKNFVYPRFDAEAFDGGFKLKVIISLSNIGIRYLKPGESFLLQVVRNYRGQGNKESVILQLFPAYIYADKRLGANNHDRRSFQKVTATRMNN